MQRKPVLRRFRVARRLAGVDVVAANEFLPVIQLAITPVILLSGVGALMLTLTNRLGRIVDRTRSLAGQARTGPAEDRPHVRDQLAILWSRARLVRRAVTFAGLSMLFSCVLVLAIFFDAGFRGRYGVELVVIFVGSVLALIAALVDFLRDIWLSLKALGLEVERAEGIAEGKTGL